MFSSPAVCASNLSWAKKSRDSRLFFFAGHTARSGHLPRYAVRYDDLGAGAPVLLSLNPNQGIFLKTSFE
jgi:hypothetical protein